MKQGDEKTYVDIGTKAILKQFDKYDRLNVQVSSEEEARDLSRSVIKAIYSKFSQQPPKERKVSLEEIERRISFSDLWISHPQRPQRHKRHLAQAILSLLNAMEERKGE